MDAPGYTKPTHGYGTPLPADCAEAVAEALADELELPEKWAGKGFTVRTDESST